MPSFKDIKSVSPTPEALHETKEVPITNQPNSEIPDAEKLKSIIKEFAEQKKAEHKMLDYLLMSNSPFRCLGIKLIFEVNNDIQLEQLISIKSGLAQYIKKLTGHAFVIDGVVESNPQENIKLYTASDKFAYLSQLYPTLLELKQKLGLELDM